MRPLRDDRFGSVLTHAQKILRQTMDDRLAEADLTTAQYAALAALDREAGLSNAELARRCFVTPQTMHSIVGRLGEDGLVDRTPHPEHERIRQLHLTEEGRARLNEGREIVEAIEERMTAEVGREEREQAKQVLLACTKALKE